MLFFVARCVAIQTFSLDEAGTGYAKDKYRSPSSYWPRLLAPGRSWLGINLPESAV